MADKKTAKEEAPAQIADTKATEQKQTTVEKPQQEPKTAKAGKRSEKATKEAEQKAAKEDRKAKGDTTPQDANAESKAKQKQNPTRARLERRGKNYRKVADLIDSSKAYSLAEALDLATKTAVGKFDNSVELHVNLNVDPRHADQNIRSTVSLPEGTGKKIRVAVFASAEQHEAAKKAGADIVGEDDFLQQLDKQQMDFDVLISSPKLMPKLGKYARLLGPRGLMPNPKSGTVTTNVEKAVQEAKAGRVEYRVDKQGIIHQSIGKASFGADKLRTNAKTLLDNINSNKPASIKGALIKKISVTTTMGPGIKVDISSI